MLFSFHIDVLLLFIHLCVVIDIIIVTVVIITNSISRNFPGLVSNTVIDWFFPWPADALQKVAEFFLLEEKLPPLQRKAVVDHLVHAHETITTAAAQFCLELRRHYYVTPKNYLDFITNYKVQLSFNRNRIDQSTRRLQGGLQKLIEAAEAVDSMQV